MPLHTILGLACLVAFGYSVAARKAPFGSRGFKTNWITKQDSPTMYYVATGMYGIIGALAVYF